MRKAVLLLPLLLAFGLSQNLLTNGDFEQELTTGWTQNVYGVVTIDRGTDYQPDPDFEAKDSLYAYGWGKLSQIVDAPGIQLALSFWARFEIGAGSSTCWPVACVTVGYYDAANVLLGETRFYYHNSYCTWVPSSTLSLIEVTNPDWTQYNLDIAQELTQHLPGIAPGQVSRVEIALYDTTSGG
jgi:hypothetical protein